MMSRISVVRFGVNLWGLAWTGLVLKWPLVFGEHSHGHPHKPEEEYIWRPNNYLNVAMIAFSIEAFHPVFEAAYTRCESNTSYKALLDVYGLVSLFSIGALVGICIPIALSANPRIGCNFTTVAIFDEEDLITFFIITTLSVLLKSCVYLKTSGQQSKKN